MQAVKTGGNLQTPQVRSFFAQTSPPGRTAQPFLGEMRATIVRAQARTAPEATFALCNEVENANERCGLLEILGRVWADRDAGAAIGAALTLGSGPYVDAMMAGIFERLAEKDPAQAYDLLQKTVAANPRAFHLSTKALGRIVRLWCMQDPAAALARVQAFDNDMRATSGLSMVVDQWMRADPQALLSALKSASPKDRERMLSAATYGKRLNRQQVAFLTDIMRQIPGDPGARSWQLDSLMRNFAAGSPAEKWKMMEAIDDPQSKKQAAQNIIAQWLQSDGEAAAKALFSMPDEAARAQILSELSDNQLRLIAPGELLRQSALLTHQDEVKSVANAYLDGGGDFDLLMNATQDLWRRGLFLQAALSRPPQRRPAAARAWVLAMPLGAARAQKLAQLLEGGDPAENIAWAQSHLAQGERDYVLRQLTRADNGQPPPLTIAVFEKLPEGRLKQDLIVTMACNIAQKDPVRAVQWISAQPPSPKRAQACMRLLRQIAASAPEKALALAPYLPVGNWEPNQAREIAKWAWKAADSDPYKTLECAQSIPNAALRQLMVQMVVEQWLIQDRAGLAARMEAVENDPQRRIPEDSVKMLGRYWSKMNPQALAQWMALRPDSRLSAIMVQPLMASWPLRDTPAALQWLDTLPPGDLRTRAVFSWALGDGADADPEGVFELVILLPATAAIAIDGKEVTRMDALVRLFEIFKKQQSLGGYISPNASVNSLEEMRKAFEKHLARPEITDAEREKIRARYVPKTAP